MTPSTPAHRADRGTDPGPGRRGDDFVRLRFTPMDGLPLRAEVTANDGSLGLIDLSGAVLTIPASRLDPYDQVELNIAPSARMSPPIKGLTVLGDVRPERAESSSAPVRSLVPGRLGARPPERPGEPCVHHVYRRREDIPEEASVRIGRTSPGD